MAINQKIIDELLSDYKNPEDLLGDDLNPTLYNIAVTQRLLPS